MSPFGIFDLCTMEDELTFPDGRTFSEIVGVPHIEIDDAEDVLSGIGSFEFVGDVADEVGVESVCDSEIPTPLTPNFKGGPPKCNVHFFLGGREG